MSDFGSSVAVYRTDGCPPADEDDRLMRAAAEALQFTRIDRIGPYDGFELRFGFAQDGNGVKGLSIALSEYLVGDDEGNDGLAPDAIIARESPVVEQFAEDLEQSLGRDYRAVAYSGYW